MPERLLVLAVDIDNDLYRKTRISGPVVGRNNVLAAAEKFVLADPQDTDANVMFESIRQYDKLKEAGYPVAIATITGAEKEGYVADAELSRQIDMILDRFKVDACVLVTDGASDNRVLPILKSRVKVNSVDLLRMKQAENLENTYFVIFEKLKEPHFARIVFGIPALLLLLFAISAYLHYGWQLPVSLIGLYLLIKGFGLEDSIVGMFKGLGFSSERLSFIFYMSAIILFIINIILGVSSYASAAKTISNPLIQTAYGLEGFILLLPVTMVLYLVGRIIDYENKRLKYKAITQGSNIGYAIIVLSLIYLAAAWVAGQIYLWEFAVFGIIVILLGYGLSVLSLFLKRKALLRTRIKNKNVVNDIGAYIGKVTGIDSKKGILFVKTSYGTVLRYDVDRISTVSDRVIIR
jgi:putative membrane protein